MAPIPRLIKVAKEPLWGNNKINTHSTKECSYSLTTFPSVNIGPVGYIGNLHNLTHNYNDTSIRFWFPRQNLVTGLLGDPCHLLFTPFRYYGTSQQVSWHFSMLFPDPTQPSNGFSTWKLFRYLMPSEASFLLRTVFQPTLRNIPRIRISGRYGCSPKLSAPPLISAYTTLPPSQLLHKTRRQRHSSCGLSLKGLYYFLSKRVQEKA